jgi:archaellum biogenesis ATPase FlaH
MKYDVKQTNSKGCSKEQEQENIARISYFSAPITSTTPIGSKNVCQIYTNVSKNKELQRITTELRMFRQLDGEELYKREKCKRLDSITPSGIFSKRSTSTLIKHSGIICVDIDNLNYEDEEAESLKRKLSNDTNISPVLIFTSPSGCGVKVFIKINIDEATHLDYFNSLLNYFKSEWGIKIDEACKDVSRACFLSYDDKAYFRSDYETVEQLKVDFTSKWTTQPKAKLKPIEVITLLNDEVTTQRLYKYGEVLKQKGICLTEDYPDWITVGYALCELGENGKELYQLYSSVSSKYDYNQCNEQYDQLLGSYDNSVGVSTLFYKISEAGIDIHYKDKDASPIKRSNIRTGRQRMKDALLQPEIKAMLGAIWQRNELHILFGDTGCGKSIWAVQIADAMTKGLPVFTVLQNDNVPQKVLIYDFELSDRQFLKRYSNDHNSYDFNENFTLSEIDFKELTESSSGQRMDELIFKQIRNDIKETKPSMLIVDNLTFLSTQTAQDTSAALDLMRELDNLKKDFGLSILVLAHTPKVKNGSPLTLNELGGSKMLSNFADSVSCIGKSCLGKDIRYLKQVKPSRSAEIVFDSESVIKMELSKTDNFLGFKFLDCTYESEHLDFTSPSERKTELHDIVLGLHKNGASTRTIEATTGIPKSTVARWLNEKEKDEG